MHGMQCVVIGLQESVKQKGRGDKCVDPKDKKLLRIVEVQCHFVWHNNVWQILMVLDLQADTYGS